jgi:hypothetical protein
MFIVAAVAVVFGVLGCIVHVAATLANILRLVFFMVFLGSLYAHWRERKAAS